MLPLAFAVCLATSAAERAAELSAYRGPGCDGRARMASFERFLGRKVDRTIDALAQTKWTNLDHSMWTSTLHR